MEGLEGAGSGGVDQAWIGIHEQQDVTSDIPQTPASAASSPEVRSDIEESTPETQPGPNLSSAQPPEHPPSEFDSTPNQDTQPKEHKAGKHEHPIDTGGSPETQTEVEHPPQRVPDESVSVTTEASVSEKINLEVQGVNIDLQSQNEKNVLQGVSEVVFGEGKYANPEEIDMAISFLRDLQKRTYDDDMDFDDAIDVYMQEARYINANFEPEPIIVEDGAFIKGVGFVDTEIIDEFKGTRPTRIDLQEADRVILSTTKGKIGQMIAYLEDYQGVMTGDEKYRIPNQLRTELKAKTKSVEEADWDAFYGKIRKSAIICEESLGVEKAKGAGEQFVSTLELMRQSDVAVFREAAQYLVASSKSKDIPLNIIFSNELGAGGASRVVLGNDEKKVVTDDFMVNPDDFFKRSVFAREVWILHEVNHLEMMPEDISTSDLTINKRIALEQEAFAIQIEAYEQWVRGHSGEIPFDQAIAIHKRMSELSGIYGRDNVARIIGYYHVTSSRPHTLTTLVDLIEKVLSKETES